MKKFALIAGLLSSLGAGAMEVEEAHDAGTGDLSVLVKNPVYPKTALPFSSSTAYSSTPSSEDGVCKILGYEKSAPGSGRSDGRIGDAVRVDPSGVVIGGPNTYLMTQIVCLNPATSPIRIETLVDLGKSDLIHTQSHLPFSASSPYSSTPSSEDGVCKALGYKRGIHGSSRIDPQREDTVQVDSDGNVVGGPNTYIMIRILCAKL